MIHLINYSLQIAIQNYQPIVSDPMFILIGIGITLVVGCGGYFAISKLRKKLKRGFKSGNKRAHVG